MSDVSARISTGCAEGFALRNAGSVGKSPGRSVMAALSAACTSRAAESMLRLRSNINCTRVDPNPLDDVISLTPEIAPSARSNGAATLAAMVEGSAPGLLAVTMIAGNSTFGMLATGKAK